MILYIILTDGRFEVGNLPFFCPRVIRNLWAFLYREEGFLAFVSVASCPHAPLMLCPFERLIV